jgi:hypothetical protein
MKKIVIATVALACLTLPARADEKLDLAVRLIAASAFVKDYCAGMKPNLLLVNAAVNKLGVDIDRLKKNSGKMMQGEMIIGALANDTKSNCKAMWGMFGDDGTVIAGIVEKE